MKQPLDQAALATAGLENTLDGDILTVELPTDDPLFPKAVTIKVTDGMMELVPERSAGHRQIVVAMGWN